LKNTLAGIYNVNPKSCVVSNSRLGLANVDRPGGDMAGMPLVLGAGATAATCASQCDANSACVAWAFSMPSPSSCGVTQCYLKSAVTSTGSSSCYTSSMKGVSSGMPYYLINVYNGKTTTLDANTGAFTQYNPSYPRPFLWTASNNVLNHQWILTDAGDGNFDIVSAFSGLCLDGNTNSPQYGSSTTPFLWSCDNGPNQRWQLLLVSSNPTTYQIKNVISYNQNCLDTNVYGAFGSPPNWNNAYPDPFFWGCDAQGSETGNHIWYISLTGTHL